MQVTEDTDSECYIPDFDIGSKKLPPPYPEFHDIDKRDLLDDSLKKDIAWSLAEGIDEHAESHLETFLGSWTCFKNDTSNLMFDKSIVEYLPMVPKPSEYPVCKNFLDDLLDIMKELDLEHIFAHADELVYSKLVHILWKFPDIYNCVIVLMGDFHQLRVRQKQIYKQYACLDFKSWFIDSGVMPKGSADQTIEGKHYYRSMRILKESFNALVQYSFKKAMLENGDDFSEIKNVILNLRKVTTSANLEAVLQHFFFEVLVEKNFDDKKGTQSKMTVAYLKDVSSLLASVAAIRGGDFQLHMEAERDMLKYCFAFDHINYPRYMSCLFVRFRSKRRSCY